MVRFIVRRFVSLVVVLFSLSVLVFVLQRVGNADPVRAYLGPNASQAAIAATRIRFGLDKPLIVQYFDYLGGLFHGDLGMSYSTRRPVAVELADKVPATLELAAWVLFFAVILAVVLAGIYTLKGPVSGVIRFVFFSFASAPSFLLATLMLLFFFKQLHWFPAVGRITDTSGGGPTGFYVLDGLLTGNLAYSLDAIQHLVLPALAASLGLGVALARVLADGLSSGMASNYARTARSLAETERSILFRHSLRNASSPALSMLGVLSGAMLSSLVVVEQIFSWNGLGQYLSTAIASADFPAVAGVSLVLGAVYVILTAIVDVVLALVDPRVKLT
ncbi:MAG: peptide/nickel transport system permease protein [Microbacteriaceae bacterium]|jgi:ABC-type dipeptide/oligopeptide/nickel transport system permease component|nr:peptide/nickel transport system permease protein [Microbacteriaceae bacterium]